MYHNDDELDRALLALPLEPLPFGLRAAILSATSAAAPAPVLRPAEIGIVGFIIALVSWLCVLAGSGQIGLGAALASLGSTLNRAAVNPTVELWLAVGVSSALALTLANGQEGRVIKHRTLVLVGRTRVHLDRVQGLARQYARCRRERCRNRSRGSPTAGE